MKESAAALRRSAAAVGDVCVLSETVTNRTVNRLIYLIACCFHIIESSETPILINNPVNTGIHHERAVVRRIAINGGAEVSVGATHRGIFAGDVCHIGKRQLRHSRRRW